MDFNDSFSSCKLLSILNTLAAVALIFLSGFALAAIFCR